MNAVACMCCACQCSRPALQISPLGCVLLVVGLVVCFSLMACGLAKAADEEAALFEDA